MSDGNGTAPDASWHLGGNSRGGVDGYVDAHVHFWDPRRLEHPWLSAVPALDRPRLPEDLAREGARPQGIVVVEADRLPGQALAEVAWVQELRDAGAPVIAMVAHAGLERGGDCRDPLAELTSRPLVRGVRRLFQDEPDGFMARPALVEGVRLLAGASMPLDLCIRRHQLAEATDLVRRLPSVEFVLDHLGKPEISPASLRTWAADLTRLAALPNVRCKLSGLATEATPDHRTAADLLPFLRHAIDAFGPGRCMFGSDWPVLTLAMRYQQWLDLVREAVSDLTAEERALIMRGTARAAYGIPEDPATRPSASPGEELG